MEGSTQSVKNELEYNLSLGLDDSHNCTSENDKVKAVGDNDNVNLNGGFEGKNDAEDASVDEEEKDNDWLDILGSGQLLKKVTGQAISYPTN